MLPNVRKALSQAIIDKMEEEDVNWFTIQKVDIKKHWDCPYGWTTLRRIVKDPKYMLMPIKQTRILDYFGIEYNFSYGVVTLPKMEDYGEA